MAEEDSYQILTIMGGESTPEQDQQTINAARFVYELLRECGFSPEECCSVLLTAAMNLIGGAPPDVYPALRAGLIATLPVMLDKAHCQHQAGGKPH